MCWYRHIATKALIICSCFLLITAPVRSHAEVVDKVIAVINDEVITQREFDRAFYPIAKSYRARLKGDELDEKLGHAKDELMEYLVDSKLTVSLAKKKKVEIDESELKTKIETIRDYYDTEEEFLQALNSKGTNLTEFRQEIKDQMLAQKLIEDEVVSKIVISPAEIQDLYDKNKERLISRKRAKVRGIMVRKSEDSPESDKKLKMEDIYARLKKGEDFAELARTQSEGPYAENGGDMGYISPGDTIEEIDNVIFNLKGGETSDIIETPLGYHLFKVEGLEEPRTLGIGEVTDFLRRQLFMKRFNEKLETWLEEKKKEAYISYK